MGMIKRTLLTLASAFLIWQSYDLLIHIDGFQTDSWLGNLFLAWVISMFITGIFALAGFAHPTQRLLPKSYYEINQPQKLESTYKLLNVALFRKLLLATLWRNKKQRGQYFDGKRKGLNNLIENSQKSEFGHLIPFVILNFIAVYLITVGLVKLGIFVFFINVLGNFYPVILQRHHRMRIQRLGKRLDKMTTE
jgi:hypothetical protein